MAQPTPGRVAFAQAIFALATALSFDLDEAVISVYWHALKDVPDALRAETLMEAGNRKWFKFPKPAELKELAATLMAAKRKAAAALHLEGCDHSSHFIEIDGKNQRCPCWERAQLAMESVGQAIALPPARDDAEIGQ